MFTGKEKGYSTTLTGNQENTFDMTKVPSSYQRLSSLIILNLAKTLFKSRDSTLPTKVRLVKAMVFPVVMYGCESWTVKKAEH